jgi:hypothetical protein
LEGGDAACLGVKLRPGHKPVVHARVPRTTGLGLQTLLGPNMTSSLRAVNRRDVEEDGARPDPISSLSAPPQARTQICDRQLGPSLPGPKPVSQLSPHLLSCPCRELHMKALLRVDRQILPRRSVMFFDQGGEAGPLHLVQFGWASRPWEVFYMAVETFLLQEVPHRALAARDSLRNSSIGEVQIFFQVDDLPTFTLRELMLASSPQQ